MHHQRLLLLARPFVIVALALGPLACTDEAGDDGTTEATLTGTWDGGFTTDNPAVPMGKFTFMITEDGKQAITGTFTGMAGTQNLAGTISGKRAADKLEGTVNFTAPLAITLTVPGATIGADTISGDFSITSPIMAKGNFMVTRK